VSERVSEGDCVCLCLFVCVCLCVFVCVWLESAKARGCCLAVTLSWERENKRKMHDRVSKIHVVCTQRY
jgi:hypothetical protein